MCGSLRGHHVRGRSACCCRRFMQQLRASPGVHVLGINFAAGHLRSVLHNNFGQGKKRSVHWWGNLGPHRFCFLPDLSSWAAVGDFGPLSAAVSPCLLVCLLACVCVIGVFNSL